MQIKKHGPQFKIKKWYVCDDCGMDFLAMEKCSLCTECKKSKRPVSQYIKNYKGMALATQL